MLQINILVKCLTKKALDEILLYRISFLQFISIRKRPITKRVEIRWYRLLWEGKSLVMWWPEVHQSKETNLFIYKHLYLPFPLIFKVPKVADCSGTSQYNKMISNIINSKCTFLFLSWVPLYEKRRGQSYGHAVPPGEAGFGGAACFSMVAKGNALFHTAGLLPRNYSNIFRWWSKNARKIIWELVKKCLE